MCSSDLLQEDMIYRLFAVLILTVAGANVVAFGLTCRTVIGLIPSRRRPRPLPLGRWRNILAGIGLAMVMSGLVLMTPAVFEWLRTRQISSHWSYFAAGGTLLLTGLQLATWFVLIMILSELAQREVQTLRDLRQEPEPASAPVASIG